ncbi:MAG: hypothetical protein U0Q16_08785 [Bryobacteraceae bacterium]
MPLKVQELIALLEKAVGVAGNAPEKKVILGDVFQPGGFGKHSELDSHDPLSKDQTQHILRLLIQLTETETKASYAKEGRQGLRDQRLGALREIARWADSGDTTSKTFANVDRYQVAVQLALRVRRPSSMNQGPQGFCGPAAVLVPYIRTDPVRYVRFVTELFDRGTASFGQQFVNPAGAPDFCNGWESDKGPAADYIALGSLRVCVEAVVAAPADGGRAFDFADSDAHATTPQQMTILLARAGYRNVQEHALRDYTTARDHHRLATARTNLDQCAQALAGPTGRLVIMLVHAKIALHAKRGHKLEGDAHVKELHELHWIFVKRLTVDAAQKAVTMKLFTWRWSNTCNYALSEFLPRYFGYICADPA